jgi:uncharacterized protein DUF1572
MLNETLLIIYNRDLNKLKEELNGYTDEAEIWQVRDGISNPAGNLTLHLIGNLNHFIGATMGNTGYVREREKEFSTKDVPRSELIKSIDATIEVVQQTLDKITDEEMLKPFPLPVGKEDNSVRFVLVNMVVHLDYHLGQINYHRRLIGKQA